MTQRIYLDNNASAPLDPRLVDYIIQTLPSLKGNPSSSHHFGQITRGLINKARTSIATFLKVKSNEIIFTSGGTESVNLAIRGLVANKSPSHIITSTVEHSCVIATCKQLEESGCEITYLPTGPSGTVLPEAVRCAIRPNTKLVALMSVNNETGVKTDIESIAKITKEHQIPFFVDAVSQIGKEEIIIPSGVSAMAFSGHKIHALQGIGLLFLRSGIKLRPQFIGGGHEYDRRAGTENVLGILTIAKAIEILSIESPNCFEYMENLRKKFETILSKELSEVMVNGEGPRTSNVSNLSFSRVNGEALLMNLDRFGVSASHGSACSSGSLEPSRVLLGMGLPLERVNSSIRFSLSRLNTEQEIDEACSIIINLVKQMRK